MMTEHIGLVIRTNDDRTAEVTTDPKGFCKGCKDTEKCRMCLSGARQVETVQNAFGACRGDVVSICNKDPVLRTWMTSLYTIPVLWLIIGAIMGAGLGAGRRFGETGGAIIFGMSGFAVGIGIILIVTKLLNFSSETTPRIVWIIEHHPARSKTNLHNERVIEKGEIHPLLHNS